jgi:hypothetical protein
MPYCIKRYEPDMKMIVSGGIDFVAHPSGILTIWWGHNVIFIGGHENRTILWLITDAAAE